jgi:hypothetical protein
MLMQRLPLLLVVLVLLPHRRAAGVAGSCCRCRGLLLLLLLLHHLAVALEQGRARRELWGGIKKLFVCCRRPASTSSTRTCICPLS